MKPRQLIIVHGPPEASQDLTESCRAFGGKDIKVYMPKLHETIDATSETHIYQVRLACLYDKGILSTTQHFPNIYKRTNTCKMYFRTSKSVYEPLFGILKAATSFSRLAPDYFHVHEANRCFQLYPKVLVDMHVETSGNTFQKYYISLKQDATALMI